LPSAPVISVELAAPLSSSGPVTADEITELAEDATELAELKASLVFSLVLLLQPVPMSAIPKTAADTAAARCVALRMCSPFE